MPPVKMSTNHKLSRTNTGEQTISYMPSIFRHNMSSYLKNLNVLSQFSKQIKQIPSLNNSKIT